MATANHWTSPYHVGSHQFARLFVEDGWEVLFVSDPISPFHFLMRRDRKQVLERYAIYKNKVNSDYKNLKIYVPMALCTPNEKPLFNTYFVANYWPKLTIPNVSRYIEEIGFGKVDLLWFDSFVQHFWIDKIRFRQSILRVADKSVFKKINPHLKRLENKLINRVDFVVYTARTLESYLPQCANKLRFVPNGVDIAHFITSDKTMPEDLRNIPKPIALYVGAIMEWFAADLLLEVAQKCRDISFVLIGKANIDTSKLQKEANIYDLGTRDYAEIPKYMHGSDVGIIPFDVQHPVVEAVNPLKLYEYMAAGLPVVATKWKELELVNSPAYLAEDSDEFADALKNALREGNRDKYVRFAQANTWRKRYKRVKEICLSIR